MSVIIRLQLCIVGITVAMMLFMSCQDKSQAKKDDIQSSLKKLRADLLSNGEWSKEDPFVIRSFNPYIGDKWIGDAVAYSCYRAGQAPGQKGPSDDELLEDLNIIAKHWNLIRVYGADNDYKRIPRLIKENNLPIKIIQGIWLVTEENNPEQKQANIGQILLGVELAKTYPDIITAISVANETQVFWSGHRMNPETLTRYIRIVRSNVDIPVTTADDYLYWNKPESKQIAGEIDFVFTHIHPLWNGKSLDSAVSWIDQIYGELQAIHPDRMIVIGETGWATAYNPDEIGPGKQGTLVKGKVGLDAQAEFLEQLDKWVNSKMVTTFIFEVFDESWKGGGASSPPIEIEKNWGVYYENRTPKESFVKYLEGKK